MGRSSYLLFAFRGACYALDAAVVREIIWVPELTDLPSLPTHFAGLLNYRGQMVPVIHLAKRFGLPESDVRLDDQVIVFEWQGTLMGMIVNETREVWAAEDSAFLSVPQEAVGVRPDARFVKGAGKFNGDLVMLLDLTVVIQDDWMGEIGLEGPAVLPSSIQPEQDAEPSRLERSEGIGEVDKRKIWRERAVALQESDEPEQLADTVALAIIRLHDLYFGVPLSLVREFTEVRSPVPVPCCPSFIVGNMNLRGDILTLVDIREALNLANPESSIPAMVMVVEHEAWRVGIVVDEVIESAQVNPAHWQSTGSTMKDGTGGAVTATIPYRETRLNILALTTLLDSGMLMVDDVNSEALK